MRNTFRAIGVVAGLLLILAAAAYEPTMRTPSTANAASLVGLAPADEAVMAAVAASAATPGGDPCILGCEDEYNGDPCAEPDHHRAPEVGDYARYGDGYHNVQCYPGHCNCPILGYEEAKHPWCPINNGECEYGGASFAFAPEQDPVTVAAVFLAMNPEAFQLVPERGAVQLIRCDGELTAHVPVSDEVLDILALHQAQ